MASPTIHSSRQDIVDPGCINYHADKTIDDRVIQQQAAKTAKQCEMAAMEQFE
jgi:hypothetical protein